MGSASLTTSFLIGPAGPVDTAAARMMLPESFGGLLAPVLFAAHEDGVPAPLGVAALHYSTWGPDPEGFRFAIIVAPPYRRRGVGRALLEAVVAEGRRWGVRGLWAWTRVSDEAGGDFLRAFGFTCARRFLHFEADPVRLYSVVRPLSDRILKAGGLPPGTRVVPLREAPAEAVALLVQRHLGGDLATLGARIAGHGADPFSPDHSVVLMAGDTVGAAALYGWDDRGGRIDAYAVDPPWRRRRAGVVLLEVGLTLGLQTGATLMRFGCWEDVQDTIKLASRAGGRVIASEGQYVLRLEGATESR